MEDFQDNPDQTQEINHPSERKNRKSPGMMLLEARRDKKLSTEEVAKQLRLSVQWIKDLENNNYTHAAALIYARGYLRSYARLVNVSPEEVIAAFEELGLEEAFVRARNDIKVIKHQAVPIISKSSRILIGRNTIRWVTVSALLVFVILGGIWWQGQKKHGDHPSSVVMQQPKQELSIQSAPTADEADSTTMKEETDSAMTQQEESVSNAEVKSPPVSKSKVLAKPKNNKMLPAPSEGN